MTYFDDTAYKVATGALVRDVNLNNPLAALKTGIANLAGDIQTGANLTTAVDSGTENTHVMDLVEAPSSLTTGLGVWLNPAVTNTGAATLNLNGLGVKEIRNADGSVIQAGTLVSGCYFHLRYTGTYWQIASASGRIDGTSYTDLTGVVNVKLYGAAGDGVTDDTAAIKAAVSAGAGGTIIFPIGTYKITAPISVTVSGTALVGFSKKNTIIYAVGCNGIEFTGPTIENIKLADLKVYGNGTVNTIGVSLVGVVRGAVVRQVAVRNFGVADDGVSAGVKIGDGSMGTWTILLDDVNVEGCAKGFVFDTAQNITMVSCCSRLNKGDPLYARVIISLIILGGTFENSNTTHGATSSIGISIADSYGISISGVYTEGLIEAAVKLDSCTGGSISGCRLSNNGDLVFHLAGTTSGISVAGCTMIGIWLPTQKYIQCDAGTWGNKFTAIVAQLVSDGDVTSANVIVDSGTDNVFETVVNGYNGASWVFPARTFTPTISFATNGNFNPTITYALGRASYDFSDGKQAFVDIAIKFTTNAYTTASGNFVIGGLPFTIKNNSNMDFTPMSLYSEMVVFAADRKYLAIGRKNTSTINLVEMLTGSGYTICGTGEIPASTASFIIRIRGILEVA